MFVDEARIFVASGKGGDGSTSFHKEKFRPKGGPDGGNGGKGGSVFLEADTNISSLVDAKDHPHRKAKPGGNGARNNRTGADSPDVVVKVPVGTVIKDEEGIVLADLARPGDSVVVAKGGRGGRGNAAFRTHERRVPGFSERGEPGEERWLRLELRLIADVAVVGFPNAGKSTLVGALSAATPKVAAYPFTTIEPSLGVVTTDDGRFTICDIPGLIEGAHEGKGLGLKFLRHAERAPIFLHMIDLTSETDPVKDRAVIRRELARYRSDLSTRPVLVVLNKADAVEAGRIDEAVRAFGVESVEVLVISAMVGTGLEELKTKLSKMVAQVRADEPAAKGFELFRTSSDPIQVKREGSAWRVTGGSVVRWVAMTDMSNPEGVSFLQNRLERAGVEKALEKAGASHGEEVRVGDVAFEWWPAGVEPPSDRTDH